MAEKTNPFSNDFEGLNRSADEKVIAMLKQADGKGRSQHPPNSKNETPTQPTSEATSSTTKNAKATLTRRNEKKPHRPKVPERPIVSFNTRITESIAEGIDDLIFRFRKKKTPRSKQDLAMEALQDLLKKYEGRKTSSE